MNATGDDERDQQERDGHGQHVARNQCGASKPGKKEEQEPAEDHPPAKQNDRIRPRGCRLQFRDEPAGKAFSCRDPGEQGGEKGGDEPRLADGD